MRRQLLRLIPLAFTAAALLPGSAFAQVAREAVDLDVVAQIREEGFERSQIEEMARHLTEVIGPRLTGSPGMIKANEWTAAKFREWGLENVLVDPWGEFGRGWSHLAFSGQIMSPWPGQEAPTESHGEPPWW